MTANAKTNTETNRRRIPSLLIAGLLFTTLATGWFLNGEAARDTAPPGWKYAATTGPVSLRVRADRTAVLAGEDGRVRMELILEAEKRAFRDMSVPTDLLVVLDTSGSMQGDKIEHGIAAIEALIDQLGDGDRFALVTYSYDAQLTVPLAPASWVAKQRSKHVLREIVADGGTNISRGLDVAYETLESARDEARASRVILISDGLANHGDSTEQGLTLRAARFTERERVLSAVGVGADFNEYVMSRLADAGTGNYYYLESSSGLAQIFAKEFSATRDTVARGVAVAFELGRGVDVVDVAGYPLERNDGRVTFRPGSMFAGQKRRVWVTYEVPTKSAGDYELGSVTASYNADGKAHRTTVHDTATIACVENESSYFAGIDKEAWEQSVVKEAYGELRASVAHDVKEGRRDEAKAKLEAYRTRQQWMNQGIGSALVEKNIGEVAELEAEMDLAFQGDDQADKRNQFSKSTQSRAIEVRRSGSKK
jgi:Ca-activated chloride channel family protein